MQNVTVTEHEPEREGDEDIMARLKNKAIILAGDGWNASPGHSSQYYVHISFCGDLTGCVCVEVGDVRKAAGKSTNVERIAFESGLSYLLDKIDVKTILTDAHPQILAFIKHSENYFSYRTSS